MNVWEFRTTVFCFLFIVSRLKNASPSRFPPLAFMFQKTAFGIGKDEKNIPKYLTFGFQFCIFALSDDSPQRTRSSTEFSVTLRPKENKKLRDNLCNPW